VREREVGSRKPEAGSLGEAPMPETTEAGVDARFRLTWREYFAAERFVGVALLVLGLVFFIAVGFSWFQPLIAAAGLVLVSAPLFRKLGLRRRWAREPLHHAEHFISFSKDRIYYLLGGVESDLSWGYFQSWVESRDGFLLVTGQDVFNLVPKRAFADAAEVDRFRTLAASKLRPVAQS
jgi:hypothetical protein